MKIIVDECLPNRLTKALVGHEAILVQKAGFSGYKDKTLLEAIEGKFEVFITIDSSLPFQQNVTEYSFSIIVLKALSNTFEDIEPLVPKLFDVLDELKGGEVLYVSYNQSRDLK